MPRASVNTNTTTKGGYKMATMMPETLPNRAETEISDAERRIFNTLKDGPGTSGWVVLHSVVVPGKNKRSRSREIDFLIMVPGGGIICLEVKGDHYKVDEQGKWWRKYGDDGRKEPEPQSPVNQSKTAMDALSAYLKKIAPRDLKGKLQQILIWHALAFTDAEWPKDAPPPTGLLFCDYKVSQNKPKLCQDLKDYAISETRERGKVPLDVDMIDSIAKMLRPAFAMEYVATSGPDLARINSELMKLTEEQFRALQMVQVDGTSIRNERVLFEGAAGTGKTMLAEQLAKLRTKAGDRVAMVFTHPVLSLWMKSRRPDIYAVGTLRDILIDGPHGDDSLKDEFDREFEKASGDVLKMDLVLAHFFELAAETMQQKGLQWDYLIVDELQYINEEYVLLSLDKSLKGGLEQGRWAMFGDFTLQNWFTEMYQDWQTDIKMGPLVQSPVLNAKEHLKVLCPGTNGGKGWVEALPLEINCRNTRPIAEAAARVVGTDPPQIRLSEVLGPPVKFYFWQEMSEVGPLLEKEFWSLHERGIKPSQVTVLSDVMGLSQTPQMKCGPWNNLGLLANQYGSRW